MIALTLRERTGICNVKSGEGAKLHPPPSNSAIRRDRNIIPVSTSMFFGQTFQWCYQKHCELKPEVRNPRWRLK